MLSLAPVLFVVFLGMGLPAACSRVATAQEGAGAPSQAPPASEGGGGEAGGDGQPVIPPGHEDVLAEMLGRGVELPGQCKFAGAQTDRSVIKSTYTCPGSEVVFELRHPSTASFGATQTKQFAIKVQSGSPPAALADALADLIRSREAGFEWKTLPGVAPKRPSRGIVVAGLLGAGVLLLLLFRRWRSSAKA